MHVRTLLKASMFAVEIDGRPACPADVHPHWTDSDRLGVVITEPFGAIGATHLMQVAMTNFYGAKPSRQADLPVYPEIYAFHIGRWQGTFAPYDFWPSRREVLIETGHHRDLLDALNDRAITRLALPDLESGTPDYRPKEVETALDRLRSCVVYSPNGVVKDADLAIRGTDRRTEHNVNQVLKTLDERGDIQQRLSDASLFKEADIAYPRWLQMHDADVDLDTRTKIRAHRDSMRVEGTVRETYRRIDVKDAILRLASLI